MELLQLDRSNLSLVRKEYADQVHFMVKCAQFEFARTPKEVIILHSL